MSPPQRRAKAKAKAPAKPADDAMKAARLHHASLPERIGDLEENIWDSADNHNKKNIGDNADKHARELAAHGAAHSLAKKLADRKFRRTSSSPPSRASAATGWFA